MPAYFTASVFMVLFSKGKSRISLSISVSFHFFLWSSEACVLIFSDVCLPGYPLVSLFEVREAVGIAIRNSKEGRYQFVYLTDATSILMLRKLRPNNYSSASLFGLRYVQLDREFWYSLSQLLLFHLVFRFHTLRHGEPPRTGWKRRHYPTSYTRDVAPSKRFSINIKISVARCWLVSRLGRNTRSASCTSLFYGSLAVKRGWLKDKRLLEEVSRAYSACSRSSAPTRLPQ